MVTINKNPSAVIAAAGPTTFCLGGSVDLNVTPVGGSIYQWYKGPTPIAGATSLTYTATTSGNYKCRVTKVASGCYKNSNTIAVTVSCKEDDLIVENTISVFPNPTQSQLTIATNNYNDKLISVINQLGQTVLSIETQEPETVINMFSFASGVYFIRIDSQNESTTVQVVKSN